MAMKPEERFHLLKTFVTTLRNNGQRLHFQQGGTPTTKTLGHVQSMPEFVRSMWQALKIVDDSIVFEPAYPNYVLDKEDAAIHRAGKDTPEIPEKIITWNIVRRAPGSIDHTPFAKAKEIQPRIREEMVFFPSDTDVESAELDSFTGPSQIGHEPNTGASRVVGMQIEGQFFDNLIQFDIWSKNNRTAEELANTLEDFMVDYRPMFLELGVTKMHFHSRVRDDVILKWRNGLVNRSLLYYVRTERVRSTPVRQINQININMEFHRLFEQVTEKDLENFLAEYQNEVISNWAERKQRINNNLGGK